MSALKRSVPPQASSALTNYRSDINGLRAIAVLSVMLHHLHPDWLTGGYVGVDIFFVISGFLITSQLVSDISADRFTLRQFYQRRINRILPALLTVSLITLIAGLWLLSPKDLIRLATTTITALVGVSNVYLWKEYGSYFSGNTAEAPMLHTWSLGVEEQYYVFWPLVLLFLTKITGKHRLASVGFLTIFLVAISEFGVSRFASASYYLLPTRAFELLLGSMLALRGSTWSGTVNIRALLGLIGIAMMIGSMSLLRRDTPFPGFNALWPCIGAALVILTGDRSTLPHRLLSLKPLSAIGLISYSLYLWHWPLIAYSNYSSVTLDAPRSAILFFVAIALATATWRWVEQPMRTSGRRITPSRTFVSRFAVPVGAFSLTWAFIFHFNGLAARFDPNVARFEAIQARGPERLRAGCHVPTASYLTPPDETRCRLGAESPLNSQIDAALIGDSYANHYTGMLDVLGKASGVSIIDYTMDGCPPLLGYDNGKAGAYSQRCIERNERAFRWLKEKSFKHVILAGSWSRDRAAGESLLSSIEQIQSAGAKVTIILGNQGFNGADSCPIRQLMKGSEINCSGPETPFPDYIQEIQAHHPEIHFIDPNPTYCQRSRCRSVLEGTPLFRDSSHLNDDGSRWIGEKLKQSGVRL